MAIIDLIQKVSAGAGGCGFCTEPLKQVQKSK